MIKFTRSTKKKIDKVRGAGSGSGSSSQQQQQPPPSSPDNNNNASSSPSRSSRRRSKSRSKPSSSSHHHHHREHADQSVASAYSTRSDYTSETGYSSANNNNYNNNGNNNGHRGMGSRRFSSAASVASISSASVFSPSIAPSVKSGGHQPLIPGSASVGGSTLGGGGGDGGSTALAGGHGLQPSSARLLRDLNNSARSSLLSSLGTAASRTFRSYKMTLPRCPPPVKTWAGSTTSIGGSGSVSNKGGNNNNNFAGSSGAIATGANEDEITLESDLELLGRTVHAVSSALTEPSKENDKFMIYDVSFNPKGCVWDALIVVQLSDDDDDGEGKSDDSASQRSSRADGDNGERRQRDRSSSRNSRRGSSSSRHGRSSSRRRQRSSSRSHHRSVSRSSKRPGSHGSSYDGMMMDGKKTFSFPIRVTCAEDDNVGGSGSGSGELDMTQQNQQQQQQHRRGQGPHPKRAKTYAVDLAVIDDMPHHPISSWSTSEAAEHRDDIKNAVEWVSYGIRRSMARSMFPQFPEGCQGRPFREIYQLNKKVSFIIYLLLPVLGRKLYELGGGEGRSVFCTILFFSGTNN
ncbi:hypothetical protein ACHAWC_008700 [Mediolabrus comicus]